MRETLSRLRAAPAGVALVALTLVLAACGDAVSTESAGNEATASEEAGSDESSDGGDNMEDMDMDDDHHHHGEVVEVSEGMAVPALSLQVEADPISGVNLFIDVENFEISPESASTDPVDGEGHLHLYVDGERQMRFYNTALHLDDLSEGEHEIMVEVSANNHSAYGVDGEAIRAMQTITVEAPASTEAAKGYEDADAPSPSVSIEAFEDPKAGWNLFFDTSDFNISPEGVGGDAAANEGYLHLMVDGVSAGRIYGPWWHLPAPEAGEHELAVELVANNGAPYLVDGEPVRSTTSITVMEAMEDGDEHSMEDGDGEMAEMQERPGVMADANLVIDVVVDGDDVQVESDRFNVPVGYTVTVNVSADRVEQIHLHGYDLLADVSAEEDGQIIFQADIPGVFEVELEESGLFLFELAVVE